MDFKQAKVAASHFLGSAARTAQTSPFGGTAKASNDTGITPTNQSLLDTFNTIATEGVAPTFDPSSDPLRALRAAINGSKGISPDVTIPTVDQILKEVDKTGNSLVDGTLLQQYEDLKLIYTTERLALEDLVARGMATSQDVKDLKQFTKVLTTLTTEIAEITKRQPVQKALYQQEIDALKAFGVKHADDKYQTISQDDIAQYDLNGDGLIGHPMEGSKSYTGVIIGIQTIGGKDNYSFLDKATMLVVKFDPVTGEPLSTGITNLHSQWDLTQSGLNAVSVPPEEMDMLGLQGVDASFKPSGKHLGERKASAEAQGTYNTQIDIPVPETLWVKNYPDGTLIELDIEGGYKTETYVEGLDKGLIEAPPEDERDDYRQVTVAEVHVTSAGIESNGDIKYAANGQVVTFKDTEGRILLRMLIGGLSGPEVDALGELGKRLKQPSDTPNQTESDRIPASSFSMAFSAGYDMGGGKVGDPNKMRKSPVKLTVDNNFLSTTNGGVYKKDGVFVPDGHLTNLKKQAVDGELKERSAEYDTLSRFTNDDDSAKYIGPKSLTQTIPKNDGIEHGIDSRPYAEHGKGAEFVLDEANGPMAMGLYGNLKMGSHNAVVEEGLRPKNIDHLDVNWTSLIDMGGGYGLFIGQNGNHEIRNATQVFVKGHEGDQNNIHTKSLLEWDATVGEKEFYGHQALFEAKNVTKYKDNPRVYVEVTGTVGGKTIIDNEVELGATDGDDYFDSMDPAGPNGTADKNTTFMAQYADDEYNVNAGEVLYTNTEDMFDVKANAGNPAINSDAVLNSYMEAETKFEEFIKKDPTVAIEGELTEGEAAWEMYGPNYAEAQESVTGFFDQYREQFGNPLPIDPALEPEPEAALDGAEKALDKDMENTI